MLKMLPFKLIFLLLYLLLVASPYVQAQEDVEWRTEQHCAAQSVESLNFGGTILLSGWAGIHGIDAVHETPIVKIFRGRNWIESYFSFEQANFAALSPDNQWLAVLGGSLYMYCPPCHRGDMRVDEILVYSTTDRSRVIRIPYNGNYIYENDFDFSLRWVNETRLIFAESGEFERRGRPNPVLISPFEEQPTIHPLPSSVPYVEEKVFRPVHTMSQAIVRDEEGVNVHPSPQEFRLIDVLSGETIRPLPTFKNHQDFAISNDGRTVFHSIDVADESWLSLLSLEEGTETLVTQYTRLHSFEPNKTHLSWSHDDRYIAFQGQLEENTSHNSDKRLHIVDTHEQVIYQTCINAGSMHWSPLRSQLAYSSSEGLWQSASNVYVFDIESWMTYPVGYHQGPIIGWVGDYCDDCGR